MFKLSKRIGIVAAVATAVIGGGVAFAAWTATGDGTANATAGGALPVTADPGVTADALYPGVPTALTLKFSNPNPYPAKITGLALKANGITVDTAHSTCNVSSVTLNTVAINGFITGTPAPIVPAKTASGDGTLPASIPGAVLMDATTSNNACQGATFMINLDVVSSS